MISKNLDEQFYSIITDIGTAQIANSTLLGKKLNLTHMAVGDSNGYYYNPKSTQTELKNEVWRNKISDFTIDEENPNWMIFDMYIPGTVGGFTVREAGLFDEDNNLIAVAKFPESYKPKSENGSSKDLLIRLIVHISNTESVKVVIDPSVSLATKKDIDNLKEDIIQVDKNLSEHSKFIYESDYGRHGLRIKDNKLEYFDGYDWLRIDVDPQTIRDINYIPLRVQVSDIEPLPEDGRIYLNSKENLYYVARNNQWYRLFVGGDEKLEQDPPIGPPTLISRTDTVVELKHDEQMEFRYEGGNWQEDNIFRNLQRNETYQFQQRYKSDDIHKASPPSPTLSVTTDKGTQIAPNAPTVKNIDFDRATVVGSVNTEVKLNSGTWYSSPHTFTGLTEETEYIAYARKKETNTHKPSPTSTGTKFKTSYKAFLYGFEVDETNLNPKTAVKYIGANTGFTPARVVNGKVDYGSWEKFIKDISYRVVVKNGIEQYKVQYDDPTKKLDGSPAIITGADGDLFTKFILIWRKYTKTTKGYKIELSNKPFTGAKSLVSELENGYNQFSNPIMILLQDLYLLIFKDRDSQTALGRGYVDGTYRPDSKVTGGTNGKGYIFGETTGELQMCFCGIEDFWGNLSQWVDGLVSDSSYNILTGTRSFNDLGVGYTKFTTRFTKFLSGYGKAVQGGDCGYILADRDGSSSTGYCDYGYFNPDMVALFGGNRSDGGNAGAFYVYLYYYSSFSSSNIGARLCFKNTEGVYVGNYLGFVDGTKLRSISGKEPTGKKTISEFRTHAQNNN